MRPQVTWEGLTDQERYAQRTANLLAKRQREARSEAAKAEEAAKVEARHAADLEAYRQRARRAFPGSDEAFARLWPNMRDQWLVERTQANLGDWEQQLASKRAMMGELL